MLPKVRCQTPPRALVEETEIRGDSRESRLATNPTDKPRRQAANDRSATNQPSFEATSPATKQPSRWPCSRAGTKQIEIESSKPAQPTDKQEPKRPPSKTTQRSKPINKQASKRANKRARTLRGKLQAETETPTGSNNRSRHADTPPRKSEKLAHQNPR